MPQLDKVHFLSQYFWLCFTYFGFYYVIVKHILPKMARILQLRKSKLTTSDENTSTQELETLKDSSNTFLENIFSSSQKFWLNNHRRLEGWHKDSQEKLRNDYLKDSNYLYIKSLAVNTLKQDVALYPRPLEANKMLNLLVLSKNLKKEVKISLNKQENDSNKASSSGGKKEISKHNTRSRSS